MDLGLPNVDILGMIVNGIWWFIEKGIYLVLGFWNFVVDWVGGNVFAAAFIIGCCIYLVFDIIYHKYIDVAAAQAGDKISGVGKSAILFLLVAAGILVALKLSG